MIYDFTARFSLSGLADRGVWSNNVCKSLDFDIKDIAIKNFALAYAEAMRELMTTDVHFLDVKVTPVVENVLNAPSLVGRTIFLEGTGARTPLFGGVQTKTAPLELALEISKNCVLGRPGRMFIRGGIGENEATVSADGQYVLNDPESFFGGSGPTATAVAALNALCVDNEPLVIPNRSDVTLLSLQTTGRTIDSFTPGGVVLLKRSRKRLSAEQAGIQAAQRAINDAWHKIKRIIRRNAGWATTAAAITAIGAILALPEAAVLALPAGAAASLSAPTTLAEASALAGGDAWLVGVALL